MSMSMHVIGIPDTDSEFVKMLEAKAFCEERGLSYPQEVEDYFGPLVNESEEVIRREKRNVDLSTHGLNIARKWNADMEDGFEIDVVDIPKDIKAIRFYCSW